MNRRRFLQRAGLAACAAGVMPGLVPAADQPATYIKGRPTMKLGTVTYNLARDWDIETILRNCKAGGFEGVELRTTHAHGVEVDLTAARRREVQKRFAGSGVELMGLGSAFDYHTPDPVRLRKDMEATKKYLILAHDVGAGGIKVRPNGLPKEIPAERTLEQIGRSLNELGRFAEGYGMQIRVEVHGQGTSLLPNMKQIMDVADHRMVGVCWNCNPTDLAGEGFDHNFDLVKDKIFVVHMRDLYVDNYPFRRLFTRLKEIGYGGYCLAEIPASQDPVRVMKYYRALWLAFQDLL